MSFNTSSTPNTFLSLQNFAYENANNKLIEQIKTHEYPVRVYTPLPQRDDIDMTWRETENLHIEISFTMHIYMRVRFSTPSGEKILIHRVPGVLSNRIHANGFSLYNLDHLESLGQVIHSRYLLLVYK